MPRHKQQRASSKRQTKRLGGKCVIPPAIPDAQLPNLIFKRDREAESAIREYVGRQAPDEKVSHAERVTTEFVLGRKLEGWDVRTDKSRYWVITSPTNLYSQELFPSLDYSISFHVGVTARVMSQPDSGVHPLEQALLSSAWRRWEQAAEALKQAEEAEEFQAVGMRCRECFVAMAKTATTLKIVPIGIPPKRSDAIGWCELLANHMAAGPSAEHVRKYLKSISKSGWQLVNWLTHASGATHSDAVLAVDLTQHILSIFGTVMFRYVNGIQKSAPYAGPIKSVSEPALIRNEPKPTLAAKRVDGLSRWTSAKRKECIVAHAEEQRFRKALSRPYSSLLRLIQAKSSQELRKNRLWLE